MCYVVYGCVYVCILMCMRNLWHCCVCVVVLQCIHIICCYVWNVVFVYVYDVVTYVVYVQLSCSLFYVVCYGHDM